MYIINPLVVDYIESTFLIGAGGWGRVTFLFTVSLSNDINLYE
ncbi:hypothetical protein [Halobacillus dabanensis]|nr:hypothetical protein [Halobacillus dabanensis]